MFIKQQSEDVRLPRRIFIYFYLFTVYLNTLSVSKTIIIQWQGGKRTINSNETQSGRGLIRGNIPAFAWRKARKPSLRTGGIPAHPNTSQKHRCLGQLACYWNQEEGRNVTLGCS
jgi:hypothetical protein